MRFSSSCLVLLAVTGADAFQPLSFGPRAATFLQQSSSTEERAASKKEERLRMMKSPKFYRQGFKDVREGVEKNMDEQFKGEVVQELRNSNYVMERDGVKVFLAKDFGFCWGVERSIALAYEAVEHYPGKTVHITNELIHNPEVNDKLEDMNVQFIEKLDGGKKNFDTVKEGDVVILPAFGASFEEMDLFDKMVSNPALAEVSPFKNAENHSTLLPQNVEVVDTTCPWVSKVWNSVDKHQKAGMTSVIHGKYAHEETVATTSFCEDYICVKDMKEAEMLADYILNGGDKEAFMKHFEKAVSKGFDPDTMLKKIGLANQTTMYKKETRAIGQLLQKTMMKKFGPAEIKAHYMEFDTICDATQVSF